MNERLTQTATTGDALADLRFAEIALRMDGHAGRAAQVAAGIEEIERLRATLSRISKMNPGGRGPGNVAREALS